MSAAANQATPRAHPRRRREVPRRDLKFRSVEPLAETERLAKNALEAGTKDWSDMFEIS